jgi:hypothetical protein
MIAGGERHRHGDDRADQHHALDAEIEHAALFDDEFARAASRIDVAAAMLTAIAMIGSLICRHLPARKPGRVKMSLAGIRTTSSPGRCHRGQQLDGDLPFRPRK